MLGDRRLAHPEGLHDVGHARTVLPGQRSVEEQLEDVATRGVCDHVEDVRHAFRLVSLAPEYHERGLRAKGARDGVSADAAPYGARMARDVPVRVGQSAQRHDVIACAIRRPVFAILILLFTLMLSLPAAASDGRRTAFADALFTAVSTICVTGLSTVD